VRVRRLVEARLRQLCTQIVEGCKRVTRSGEQHSKVREWLTELHELLICRASGIRGAASRT
jgi:hypothetical protein